MAGTEGLYAKEEKPPAFSMDESEEKGEAQERVPEGRPSWRVQVEYSNHITQDTVSYDDYLPDQAEELYSLLTEYFNSSL